MARKIDLNPLEAEIAEIERMEEPIKGLSQLEMTNPNSIVVTIADQKVPIIVLFGPTTCGKTMTLIRLTRYLQKNGYKVSPVRSFRPAEEQHYDKICNTFNQLVSNNNAAEGTNQISFMLVDILSSHGKRICQILEAPGEYYYNPQKPDEPFPAYINTIINSNNRKIWLFMVEPDWLNQPDRDGYVNKIRLIKNQMRPYDQAIFIYNKVDKSNFVISPGQVNISAIINDVNNMYPGIFTPFVNQNPITKLFSKYNCELLAFSNGSFTRTETIEGKPVLTYQQGVDDYPGRLWNRIKKHIRG